MKNSFLVIRSSKSRKFSAHGPRPKLLQKDHPRSITTVEDLIPHDRPFSETSQRHILSFNQQELTRLDLTLDSWEITQQNSSQVHLESLPNFLKDFSICLRSKKDFQNSNRLLRLALVFEKSLKTCKTPNSQPLVLHAKSKLTRENFTQTLNGITEELVEYNDTSKDIQFIKGLIGKFDKLRGMKIMGRLVDLHKSLSKIDNELPSPIETPEPFEDNLRSHNHQLSIFVKVLKQEIRNVLSKNNVEVLKVEKSVQVNVENRFMEDSLKEKAQDLVNVKSQLEHKDKELEVLKENLNRCRGSLALVERKSESVSLELIQVTNKFRSVEDELKSTKTKLSHLIEYSGAKKERRRKVKRLLKLREKEVFGSMESIKGLKESLHGLMIEGKVKEEKLAQIEEAWARLKGEEFEYKGVNTIEISSKYGIFKPVEDDCLSPDEVVSIQNSDQGCRRSSTLRSEGKQLGILSYKASPMSNHEKGGEFIEGSDVISLASEEFVVSPRSETELPLRVRKNSESLYENRLKPPDNQYIKQDTWSKHTENYLKGQKAFEVSQERTENLQENPQNPRTSFEHPARRRESVQIPAKVQQKRRLSAITVENLSNSLSTIIENSPIGDIPIETFAKFAEFPSKIQGPSLQTSDQSSHQHRRKGFEELSLNLNKVQDSQIDQLDSLPRTPLLQCLINEKDSIYRTYPNRVVYEKQSKAELKHQETQCTLLMDSPTKIQVKSPTNKKRRANVLSKELDDATLENLKKLSQESGLSKEFDEIDALPPAIQVEIIKCFEGHDSKRCEKFCIHLKRALAVRYKERGVPYPIKTVFFNSQIN